MNLSGKIDKKALPEAVMVEEEIILPENEIQDKVRILYDVIDQKEIDKKETMYSSYKKAGEDFLANNAKSNDVKVLSCGVQYRVIKEGTGKRPNSDSQVTVHYEGRLIDGTVFDTNSRYGDEPVTFQLNRVIKGWGEALKEMPEGSEWEIFIPQELAYGDQEIGDIKPYSTLIFTVELLKVR